VTNTTKTSKNEQDKRLEEHTRMYTEYSVSETTVTTWSIHLTIAAAVRPNNMRQTIIRSVWYAADYGVSVSTKIRLVHMA